MKPAATLLICLLGGCTMAERSAAPLEFHRAHWVEATQHLEPICGDFMFQALAFASPHEGWVVGNRFALHLQGDDIRVAFLRPRELWLWAIDLSSDGTSGIAGGFRRQGWRQPDVGAVLRHRDAAWHLDPTEALRESQWIMSVAADPQGADWAAAALFSPPSPEGVSSPVGNALLQRRDGRWVADAVPPDWRINALCNSSSASTWVVGAIADDNRWLTAFAARRQGGGWEATSLPALAASSVLSHVTCPHGGGVVALGHAAAHVEDGGEIVLLRWTDRWERIPLPAKFAANRASALAAVSTDDVWLAVSCILPEDRCRPRFLHWAGGAWRAIDAPTLPAGRRDGYTVSDMQFVSADEGWAIANDYDGPGLVRGLLFHYRDGVWRNRNWDWHFWDQPGFGLFGD